MSVSQINKVLTKVYQKGNPGEKIGTTSLRKVMISFTRDLDDTELGHRIIANQANHSVETANRHYDTRDMIDDNLDMLENVLIKRKQALEKHSKDNKVSSWLDKNIPKSSSDEKENPATQHETFQDISNADIETATSIDLSSVTRFTKHTEHYVEQSTENTQTTIHTHDSTSWSLQIVVGIWIIFKIELK